MYILAELYPTVQSDPVLVKSKHLSIPLSLRQSNKYDSFRLARYFRKCINTGIIALYLISHNDEPILSYHTFLQKVALNGTRPRHMKLLEKKNKVIDYLLSTLTLFDPSKSIELHTDASYLVFGAVLLQNHKTQTKFVEYFSMRIDHRRWKKDITLETLAVISAITHFRHYLFGRIFKLVTDCNSLQASRNQKKVLLPRVNFSPLKTKIERSLCTSLN